jgi:hypothetical protein
MAIQSLSEDVAQTISAGDVKIKHEEEGHSPRAATPIDDSDVPF